MAAKDILRSNKTSIVETLCADYKLILNKADENKFITRDDYGNLEYLCLSHLQYVLQLRVSVLDSLISFQDVQEG
ncbi:Homeobox protein SMOX-4 [Dissostichus eleginoides]|uniref:Homeobox protein SMOX-4 n=1 Tax=Dissostichus eleginoides TaxID=100907 RepID=A0AAD9CQL1_DISEL|nr:Homeobox protein SMOX-4 [Dissostichus eleginoides]